FFDICSQLLAPDGVLYIEVPNQFASLRSIVRSAIVSLGGSIARHRLYAVDNDAWHHAYFFTPATLARLARAMGFQIIELSTYQQGNPQMTWDKPRGGRLLAEAMHRVGGAIGHGPTIEMLARHRSAGRDRTGEATVAHRTPASS